MNNSNKKLTMKEMDAIWSNELKDNKIIKDLETLLKDNGLTISDLAKLSLTNGKKYSKNMNRTYSPIQNKEPRIKDTPVDLMQIQNDIALKKRSPFGSMKMPTFEEMKANYAANAAKVKEESRIAREQAKFVSKWKNLMVHLGLYNKVYKTFSFKEIKIESYGIIGTVTAITGLTLNTLKKSIDEIESEFNCSVYFVDLPDSKRVCTMKFIKPNLAYNQIKFEPYKVKPYELYFGLDETGEPVIADRTKAPHTLIAGQTGKGKNGALDHALISCIEYTDPEDLWLILLEGYKSDLVKYSLAPHTQAYITDFIQMKEVMIWVSNEMYRRIKLFMPMLLAIKGDNLKDYNAFVKGVNKKLPYVLIVVDEFLGLMPSGNTTKDDATEKAKSYVRSVLQAMAQIGRSVGLHYIISHQKPEKELMPTFLKNMTSTRVCFGFTDAVCSEIVLGNKSAHKLPERRAVFASETGEERLFYTTDLRGVADDYIKKNRIKRYRTDTLQAKLLGEESLYNILGYDAIREIDPLYASTQFNKKYDTEPIDDAPKTKKDEKTDKNREEGIIDTKLNLKDLFN